MVIECISKNKLSSYEEQKVTFGKKYDVISDYRKRVSGQKNPDNGFVILNDINEIQMVFLDKFKITDSEIGNTYAFEQAVTHE